MLNNLKGIVKFFTSERLTGLIIFLVTLLIFSLVSVPTAAWAISGIVLSAYFGGLRIGLLAGVIASVWTWWFLGYDINRLLQVSVNLIFTGGLVGWLKHSKRRGDSAILRVDTNIVKLKRIGIMADELLANWNHFDDNEKRQHVRLILEHISQLVTLTQGWHDLYVEKEAILSDYESKPIE